MKTPLAIALALGLLLGAAAAHAQGDHPPGDDVSSPPPLPRPPGPTGPPCRLAEHSGIEDTDAATAAQLVCTALARAGAPATARYRVGIGRLGSVIILSLALEGETFGSTADTREMRLASIEDVPGAAPRIAAAIVHGTVIEDIEAPPPVVPTAPEVPRSPPPSQTRVHFALGMVGQFPPLDRSPTPAAGADLELHAEINSFEIVTDLRFGGDDSNNAVGVTFVEFSMGGRYFTSESDVSPFVGGGFAWSYLNLTDNVHNDFNGNHNGLGAYGELGVEIGRTHHTHLAFAARLDAPFYSLNNDLSGSPPTAVPVTGSAEPPLQIGTLYYAPLSLEIRVTF